MEERYLKNTNALSSEEVSSLFDKSVCVIGCGGLGGYIIETLSRIGIQNLTIADYDVFEESNLNRQLFSTEKNLGKLKAIEGKNRVKSVNSKVKVNAVIEKFNKDNGMDIVKGHDVVVDALDNINTRFTLQKICKEANIPLVHGSIGGWYGQVTTILPGDDTLNLLYNSKSQKGIESELGNLPFTASLVASIECSEVIKLLTNKGETLSKQCLRIDLLDNEYITIDLY